MTHRIGIIGCGWFAPFHLQALQALQDRTRVVWAADPVLAKAEAAAASCGAVALTDYRDGLDQVDCVHILLPHHLHCDATVACLEAGKHVLLEKPIATTLADADEMIASAERHGKTLMVGYLHRYRRSMQLFREAITDGRYGRLFMLDGQMDESAQAYVAGWLQRRATLGGGVFFSSSPHMLDVMLWIAGDVRCASVVGTRAGCDMECEDTACAVIKFESGVVGVTRHTWASPKSRTWYTLTATCESARVILTTTPAGDLVNDGPHCPWATRIVVHDDTEEVLLESDEGLDLVPEIEHFLDCVETGATPQTDGVAARKIIALVLDAYADAEARGGL
jgi:predicted dehydrogenase